MDQVLYVEELTGPPGIHRVIEVWVQVEDLPARGCDARSFSMFEQVKIA
jgi:hypothetical protein